MKGPENGGVNSKIWFDPSVYTEETAKSFMETLNKESMRQHTQMTHYNWITATNLTDYNEEQEVCKYYVLAILNNCTFCKIFIRI